MDARQYRSTGTGALLAVALGVAFALAHGGPGGTAPVEALERSAPVRLTIDAIGVDAPLTELGLNPDGTLEDPPLEEDHLAGWYALGASPGERGPAVITGHLDTRDGPAVFARLAELRRGDTVRVLRADGSRPVFVVERVEQVAKEDFPTERVYGPLDRPELRLVTCAGEFDEAADSYTAATVVYARMVESAA
ncbi:class F sortase [Thermobifida cellulosilytica]|uniref:Peptidase C60 n=1 Tax=Thermobifida cellulosilytica TB100 TaxID=665004 RepID=A0A147KDG8_THECS|nr:class F sortase [Thermobifida cellulosilytica]KUP95324.1 peptidase C60 [Thermobifida cellulosilytica TB100]